AKINLIKDKELGLSHRELGNKFQVSISAVSNILKRKQEYISDYESNLNKKVFNQWNDASEKILAINGIRNDDDTNIEHPPSLSEVIIMVRHLHLLSTTQYPELHLIVT
ncbi:unnamed protein product, partial [Rotaria sp. Silwood1]